MNLHHQSTYRMTIRPKLSKADQLRPPTYSQSMPAKLPHRFLAFAHLRSEHPMNAFNDWMTTTGIGLLADIGRCTVSRPETPLVHQ
jgi:hypothetical protein